VNGKDVYIKEERLEVKKREKLSLKSLKSVFFLIGFENNEE